MLSSNVDFDKKVQELIGQKAVFESGYIFGVDKKDGHQTLCAVRAWGAIQNLFVNEDKTIDIEKAESFQDYFGEWIADAIEQKLKRTKKVNHKIPP